MDIITAFQNLNWLAVIVAALSTFFIGGLWYSPLMFEKMWLNANNFHREDLEKRNMPLVFGLSFLLSFIMSLNLALFIGQEDTTYGAIAGFMTGFGWVFLAIGVISLFENRSWKYVLINGGYMMVAFTLMGVILGAWN